MNEVDTKDTGLSYETAEFAMAKKDIWVNADGHRYIGYKTGFIYPIHAVSENRRIETDKSMFYLPINTYAKYLDDFEDKFVLAKSGSDYIEPYSTIRVLRAELYSIESKHCDELKPIFKRHAEEKSEIKDKIEKLEQSV